MRGPSPFSPLQRERIAAYVSHRNGCAFCRVAPGALMPSDPVRIAPDCSKSPPGRVRWCRWLVRVTNRGNAMTEYDHSHLQRCIELAKEALNAGDAPFGSVLVDADGNGLAEDRNRGVTDNVTHHPEFELARWAARNLDPDARAAATVYTSGEHCPMCAAAHAMTGLGRIVYIVSSRQFAECLAEFGHPPGPVRDLSIQEVTPAVDVVGPITELAPTVLELYRCRYGPA